MNQSWLTKPSGAVPVAKPTLIFLPRSPKVNHWKSTVTCGFCSMKSLTRLWTQGRCCGFSKVQKLELDRRLACAERAACERRAQRCAQAGRADALHERAP